MSYHDLLNQYGHEQPQVETRVYIFAQAPQKLTTPDEVAYRDKAIAVSPLSQENSFIGDLSIVCDFYFHFIR